MVTVRGWEEGEMWGPGSQVWKMSKFERAAANTAPAVNNTALYTSTFAKSADLTYTFSRQ